ncbi:MAG: nicotinamide mononucleotide transporter [Kiritimatiellae bacterium]|nr:nicotinamide mononucleotide transporter [Kiritimatiellia bacterium]
MKKIFIEQFIGWRTQEILWLVFSIFSITALSIYWDDTPLGIIAATTGMAYTILAGKGKISCFIFGLINTPLYAYLAFKSGYYGDLTLNAYYFIMMFPGLFHWLKNRSQDPEEGIKRTKLSNRGRLILAALCIGAIIPTWAILKVCGGAQPLCDSATNILSIAAMILTVRRAIEEWALWILVNAIEVFMWYKAWLIGQGNVSILLMWLLFLANGVYLLCLWLRIEKRNNLKPLHAKQREEPQQ